MIQFAAQGRFKARYNDPDHLKGKSRGGTTLPITN